MDALIDYLAMGGYWRFVWPAYGVAALVLIALLATSLRSLRANEAALDRLDRERPRGRRRGTRGLPAGEAMRDA